MRSISIVVNVHQVPEALRATLDAVRAHTPALHELIVFADGPDRAIEDELPRISRARILRHDTPRGAAAVLNRAFIETTSEVVVLLESGSVPGPGWLDLLLEPFDVDTGCGLSGPSTNMSWNEQGAFAGSGGAASEIAATAEQARLRFGKITQPLKPLYSLADFCYVVRRPVFEAIGPAEETYGLGPCWEMDYNVRAERAGFHGLWVCAAYVYRGPFTPRRRQEEGRLFERNKRIYQSKFCGRQLRTPGTFYRTHCSGDACPEFAPVASIAPSSETAVAPPEAVSTPPVSTAPVAASVTAKLVSCILLTYNRAAFIRDSVRMFLSQDYPHRELVVVDDGTDPVSNLLPKDDRIRYWRLPQKLSIGAKRNHACNVARGEFIAHWDDDDWFPTSRISRQVQALEQTGADVCGTSEIYYYDPENNKAYKYSYSGSPAWLTGLLYRRTVWQRQPFEDIQVGEDTRFLWNPQPKRIHDMHDPALFLARLHRGNSSPKLTDCVYWRPVPVDVVLPLAGKTLVSCIMLTRNRPAFAKIARELFESQDYPHKELLIVDNGEISVADLAKGNPAIRYIRTDPHLTLGEKRRIGAKGAAGDIIVHWDDDDWYSPQRLRYQVTPILNGEADVTGLENRFLLDLSTGAFWTVSDTLHLRMFVGNVHGGTLSFHRRILNGSVDYPAVNLAEDAGLLRSALQLNFKLQRLPNPGVYVYVRHSRNTWQFQPGSFLDPSGWKTTDPPAVFPAGLVDRYRKAAGETAGVSQWRH